ncbi:MAG: protein-L-isoaspartate(D-aspartate) O-methyltransferase [Elioraea tepidiphila]
MAAPDRLRRLLDEIAEGARETAGWTGRAAFAPRVMQAIARARRDAFVPPTEAEWAYLDRPLPIGHGQTISQPYIVALMTDVAAPKPGEKVLEIGTGSGWQAAVLAALGARVFSVEVIPELSERAAAALAAQGFGTVRLRVGDGWQGWPEEAPFDAILVTAAAPEVPQALLDQLAPGGRMVIPLGAPHEQQMLTLFEKAADGTLSRRDLLPVAFVPLVKPS